MTTDPDQLKAWADTARAYGGGPAYERAKAAGKTKLAYEHWVTVRTPDFKQQFGDWEGLRTQKRLDAMKLVGVNVPQEWRGLTHVELRREMAKVLDRMVRERTEIEHPELGQILVGRVGAKKSENSARDPAKSLVAADIKSLIPTSIYARSEPSRGGDGPDVDGYSTLFSRVHVDSVFLVAAFTVRHQSDGRWYYNAVTLHDQNEKARDSYGQPDLSERGSSHAPIAGLDSFIRRSLSRVNPASVSANVDFETGEPLAEAVATYALNNSRASMDLVGRACFAGDVDVRDKAKSEAENALAKLGAKEAAPATAASKPQQRPPKRRRDFGQGL